MAFRKRSNRGAYLSSQRLFVDQAFGMTICTPRMRKSDSERRALRPKTGDYVEALARGLAVLHAFSDGHRASLSEIARLVDIPKPSVRRTLITLSDLGYVSSTGRQFELTPKVVTLAAAYLS